MRLPIFAYAEPANWVFVALAALVLAGDMVGAIIVSGIAKGEIVSLTLAPAELAAMLIVLWAGPGAYRLRWGSWR